MPKINLLARFRIKGQGLTVYHDVKTEIHYNPKSSTKLYELKMIVELIPNAMITITGLSLYREEQKKIRRILTKKIKPIHMMVGDQLTYTLQETPVFTICKE